MSTAQFIAACLRLVLTTVGLFFSILWMAGSLGIGDFQVYYGPKKTTETTQCSRTPSLRYLSFTSS